MIIVEKYYPVFLSIILTGLIFHFSMFIMPFQLLMPLLRQSMLTISATLLGFLLTILTVIHTISTRRMQWVKDFGAFPRLMGYLSKSITSNMGIILFSLIELFIQRNSINPIVLSLIDYGFIFLSFLALLLTTRFAMIFVGLLVDKSEKPSV